MVQKHHHRWLSRTLCLAIGGMLAAGNLWAQSAPLTLKQAFEAAWSRQPEAQSLAERREAAEARRQSADSWTAEPPSLEVSAKTDQLNKNQGSREYVAGIALPLWLPGERSRTGALADAESRATASRALGSQLRTAATVREAWWAWQRARIEKGLAQERLNGARQLASDVVRRVKAGDLARSDQHQADGAAATAEVALAETNTALATATQQLRALIGMAPISQGGEVSAAGEPAPAVPADFAALDTSHPAVIELLNRAEVARRGAELAEVQTRANPELTLATTRDRGVFGDPYQQTVTVGIRFPSIGQSVRKGDVLAYVVPSSGQIERANQSAQLAELRAARSLAEKRVARLRELADTVPKKEIEAAESELASLTERVSAVGGGLSNRDALIAPVSGLVASSNAVAGQVVDARELVFEVVDPKRLRVEALAYDPEVPADVASASIAVGQERVSLIFLGGARSMREQALPLMFRGEDERLGRLAVGQPMKVFVQSRSKLQGYSVPAASLMKNPANQTIVWVKTAPERFEPRTITVEPLDGANVAVISGLKAGDRVVTRAATLVNQVR